MQNYTELRLEKILEWVKKHWLIDENNMTVEGSSMGGTGAASFGFKRGDKFAYIEARVGIYCWPDNAHFRDDDDMWGARYKLKTYNGYKFDEWMDEAWFARKFPEIETPFISLANGKNDTIIGWSQAVKFVNSLRETKRPFLFVWGLGKHGQGGLSVYDYKTMAGNMSLPAFNNCSLDDNYGKAETLKEPKKYKNKDGKEAEDTFDGIYTGQVNAWLRWEGAAETVNDYSITLYLIERMQNTKSIEFSTVNDKEECTVDMTPRRCRTFKAKPGQKFAWTNTTVTGNKVIQQGEVTADARGLVTLEKLMVSKGKNRITIKAL